MTHTTMERRWALSLPAEYGHCDITSDVEQLVLEAGILTGVAVVQMVGSTGGVTTIEYESGALSDLKRALDTVAPAEGRYEHNQRWGDGNGFSHLRSALMKTAISIPVVNGRLALGVWQQIVALNFDDRGRSRELVAVVVGV